MFKMRAHINNQGNNNGFSLVIILLLVSIIMAVITGIISSSGDRQSRELAVIAGWEGVEIARAARVFVREQVKTRPNLRNDLSNATEDITVQDLIDLSLLPSNFARTVNGDFVNILGQRIRIIIANYPINGDPSDIVGTVPTAYVYLEDNERTDAFIAQSIIQQMRRENVAISAPFYNGETNISPDCNANGISVVIWDTGCLGATDFINLTGDTFVGGSLIIPVWRTVNFDNRAIMRFPQPESGTSQSMLTSLYMGEMHDCDTDATRLISIPSENPTGEQSDICGGISDTGMVDNRRDIQGVRNIEASTYISDPQSAIDVRYDANNINNSPLLDNEVTAVVAGNMTSLSNDGDIKVFEGDVQSSGSLVTDNNIYVTRKSSSDIQPSAYVALINTGDATTQNMIVTNSTQNISANISATTSINVLQSADINTNVVASNLQMENNATSITVNQAAQMVGSTNASSINTNNGNVQNGGSTTGYQLVAGRMNIEGNLSTSGNMRTNDGASFAGGVSTSRIDITNGSNSAQCQNGGDCPRRDDLARCQAGYLGFTNTTACMNFLAGN